MRHHKVYVALGFHVSGYHSWRGDMPDEAGFGTDIRVIREILRMLNDATRRGLSARGYWDWDVYYTVQQILPQHAPASRLDWMKSSLFSHQQGANNDLVAIRCYPGQRPDPALHPNGWRQTAAGVGPRLL